MDQPELERELVKPRRKGLKAFASVAILLTAVVAVAFSVSNRSPLPFLDRFHPAQFERLITHPTGQTEAKTVLVFSVRDEASILAALKRELSTSRGFSQESYRSPSGAVNWIFTGQKTPGDPAIFTTTFFPALNSSLVPFLVPNKPDYKCQVTVEREPNWFDRAMHQVREFLRI